MNSFLKIDAVSDEELCARLNMADAKFTFADKAKSYHPQWMAPEALGKSPKDINVKAADMWSFAILLWELSTREIPFPELSPMEAGMKVKIPDPKNSINSKQRFFSQIATEGLRIEISPGISPHMAKLIRICMNEDPGKRPSFEQVITVLEKMKKTAH